MEEENILTQTHGDDNTAAAAQIDKTNCENIDNNNEQETDENLCFNRKKSCADEPDQLLMESYSEISLQPNPFADKRNNDDDVNVWKESTVSQRPISLTYDTKDNLSFPYDMEGTVSVDGAMTNFVAENLEYKIKIASPVTKKDTNLLEPSMGSRANNTPTYHFPRKFLQQSQQMMHQIDINVLSDVEIEAQYLAASVDSLAENLCNLLHSISSITADNLEVYKNSVNKLTDNMDSNIKSMYTIMAKTEEISNAMKPMEQLNIRIKEIKRLADMLESNM